MKQRSSYHLADAIRLHQLDCQVQRFTPRTLESYRTRLKRFSQFTGDVQLHKITSTTIREFQLSVQQTGVSARYQHGLMTAVRAFFNFCVRDELIEKSPVQGVKMPRVPHKVLPAVTDDEMKKALAVCDNPRDKAILLTLVSSGVRANEVVNLKVKDFDLSRGQLFIDQGKMQRDRIAYVDPAACKAIAHYLNKRKKYRPDSALFASLRKNNAKINSQSIAQLFNKIQAKTGIAHITAHGLRRTFAMRCLRNKIDVHVVAKLMGHTSILMLRQYLDVQDSDASEAYRAVFG